MAATASRSEAFDLAAPARRAPVGKPERKRDRGPQGGGKPERRTAQLCLQVGEGLRPILKYAASMEGVTLGKMIEPLIVGDLIRRDYLTSEKAEELGLLRSVPAGKGAM